MIAMFLPPPILAFGWANLPMLGWLAAAAAPVVIHLWSRQRYRETSWAAMEYLLAAVRRQARRLQLEQWLLLAIRTLLIVLLVLAVAEPYSHSSGFAVASAEQTHRVLVLDGSYSMAYRPTDKSRFEQAKDLAAQIVQQGRQGDAFTLLLMSSPPRAIVGTPALEPGEMLAEIDAVTLPHTSADLPATVAMVRKTVEKARRESRRFARHEVYFLTDLGRVGWLPDLTGKAATDFREHSAALAKSATLVVIDLGQPSTENIAITALRSLEPVVTPAKSAEFEATVKDFGRSPPGRREVQLLVDGRAEGRRQVDLPPAGEVTVSFSHRFEAAGEHAVEVRVAGDSLDVDNHRWLAVPVRPSLRVLCINGRPSGEPFSGATDYLVYALSPQTGQTEMPSVQPEVAPESALLERDLDDYQCIFLCDVAQFTSDEARVLDDYLQRGGSLVFFLGESVLAHRYNQILGGGAGGTPLLPARLDSVVEATASGIDPLAYRHAIVHAFKGHEQAGLLTAPVNKYFRLHVPENSSAGIALKTASGDPLIVEHTVHRGRLVLVATSADTSWAHIPVWHSYVPLVQELLQWCVAGQIQRRNVLVGATLEASVPWRSGDTSATVRGPQGRSREVRLHAEAEYGELRYDDTGLSGVYTAQFGPAAAYTRFFAVNVDTAESDLTQLSEQQLRTDVWPGIELHHQTTWSNVDEEPLAAITRPGRLHVYLLYVVLGLLFVETFLAWRFGHHTS